MFHDRARSFRTIPEVHVRNAPGIVKAVIRAMRERMDRVRRERGGARLADELNEIAQACSALPVLDPRTAEEILGHDEHGLPR
jgi:antitoxin VapB